MTGSSHRPTGSDRSKRALHEGLRRGWLVLLLLALLPAANSVPAPYRAALRAGLLVAALLAWAATIAQRPPLPAGSALLDRSRENRQIGLWEQCLLVLVGAAAALYIGFASRIHEIVYNDGAYYYGVARHIALTGRFEEPIVWHFLHPPDAIVHAPFDYWGSMTSLLLVPPLVLFGATPSVAILSIGAISAASVVAFWYLVCVALPLRYRATQLLALVIFAFSPAMDLYRFQPESIVVAQLFLLLALIAFCLRRFVWALLSGFCILLTRSDGVILFSLIFLAVLFQEGRGVEGRARRVWVLAVVGLACMAVYALWSFVSFGTLTPPAPQMLPVLWSYMQVYDYGGAHQRPSSAILDRFTVPYLAARISRGIRALRSIPFAPGSDWWLALGLLSPLGLLRNRKPGAFLIWILGVGGYFLVVCVSGSGFAPFRTPYTFAPLIILAGALGIDAILGLLEAWMEHGRHRRAKSVVIGAGIFALCSLLLGTLSVLQRFPTTATPSHQAELARLDDLLRGEPIASNLPWYMIAYTRSPTVSIPMNGATAIEAVLDRYRVRWMVIFPHVRMKSSASVIARILASDTTDLGRFQLQRVTIAGQDPAVFRVAAPEPRP